MKHFTKTNSMIVKGFAIILLLIYHLFGNEFVVAAWEVDYGPLPFPVFHTISLFGNICVSLFVFLTAFGISAGLFANPQCNAEKAYQQATGRFFRLMGNFFLLYLSVNLLWWNRFDYASVYGIGKQGLLNCLLDAAGLHNLAGTGTINVTWWYMKIAYIMIFLVPLLVLITKKTGYTVLILVLLFPVVIPMDEDVRRYLFTAGLGVCAAYGGWFEKLVNYRYKVLQWMAGLFGLGFCVILRQNDFIQQNYLHVVDAGVSLFLVYFAGVLLAGVPVLKNVLEFVGKHSMNIYLVHTFFYLLLWQEFIYAFHYAGLILLVLLIVSLSYSIVLEFVKRQLLNLWKWVKGKFCEKYDIT